MRKGETHCVLICPEIVSWYLICPEIEFRSQVPNLIINFNSQWQLWHDVPIPWLSPFHTHVHSIHAHLCLPAEFIWMFQQFHVNAMQTHNISVLSFCLKNCLKNRKMFNLMLRINSQTTNACLWYTLMYPGSSCYCSICVSWCPGFPNGHSFWGNNLPTSRQNNTNTDSDTITCIVRFNA